MSSPKYHKPGHFEQPTHMAPYSEPDHITCPDCGAFIPLEICPACNGSAWFSRNQTGYVQSCTMPCQFCAGDGLVAYCDACDLKENKALSKKRNLDV